MGSYFSTPSNNNSGPSDDQIKKNIISLKETSQDDIDNFTVDNEQLNRFRELLLTTEYKPNHTGGARSRKPTNNKYKKYDASSYLKSLHQQAQQKGGSHEEFQPMTEIDGLDELRKIINSISEEQTENNQFGGSVIHNTETSPLTDGIRLAIEKFQLGGNKKEDDSSSSSSTSTSSSDKNIANELDDSDEQLTKGMQESAFSETSPFYENNNDSFTISSIKEDSLETKAATINVLPFYSSESSSSFQHPYTKSRFN